MTRAPSWPRTVAGCAVALACLLLLPLSASAVGREARVVGTLVETHGHRPDGTMVGRSFSITSRGRVRRLADAQPDSLVGQRVTIDDADAASGLQGDVRASGDQRLAAAAAPGPRSLLVILLTAPGNDVASATPAQARSAVFTASASANALYRQQSVGATQFVGKTRVDGDVTEPLRIQTSGCVLGEIAANANAAAVAAGWAPSAYDHVLYALPTTACGSWGDVSGRRLWISGPITARIVAHELGHNLGARHANSYRCTNATGSAVTLSSNCATTEYGDPFDIMGATTRLMSSWHRAQVGQLPAGQELRPRQSQTVTLRSSDDFSAAGPRLLLVARKQPGTVVSSWLAAELRSVQGPFDLWPLGSPVTTGLSVRLVPNLTVALQSELLDAKPATASFGDAPLQVGDTLRDDGHGIAIRLNTISGTAANVTVTMPALVDDVPPSAPAGISYRGDTNGVVLTWGRATDDEAVAQYEVHRDGVLVGTTPGLVFDDARVAELSETTYRVTAVDASGNRGAGVSVAAVLADRTRPSSVPGVGLSVSGPDVTVSWAAAQDNRAVSRYRVSRNGEVRSDVAGLSFTERPPAGQHRYAVSAVDTAGNVGPQTEVLMPSPPPPPPPVSPPPPPPGPPPPPPPPVAPPPPPPAAAPASASTPLWWAMITGTPSLAVAPVPIPATAAPVARPRIVLVRRSRRGRVFTMSFAASRATSMRAYRAGRRLAGVAGPRLTIRLRVARGALRPTVKIVASSAGGSSDRRYALR